MGDEMKNAIKYYYNLNVENIHFYHQKYFFNIGNSTYSFITYNRAQEEIIPLFELNKIIIQQDPNYYQIVPNRDKMPITVVDNIAYILLRLNNSTNREIQISDIHFIPIILDKKIEILNRFSWTYLWSQKIDYIEYQLKHYEIEFPALIENVWYFIGMGENAISYVQNIIQSNNMTNQDYLTVAHRRLSSKDKLFDYYNPITLVVDHPARDVAEYLKSSFLNDTYDMAKIEQYIKSINFTASGYGLLFGRLLFPSFYFDIFQKVINKELEEKNILLINERIHEYELYLNDIFIILKKKADIEPIDWLIKKT